jgi:LPXTG-motif cell wall-anchored protein
MRKTQGDRSVRHLVLLASVYALVGVLVLPGSLAASDEPAPPAAPEAGPTETAAAEQAPATPAPAAPEAQPAPAAQPSPTPPAEQELAPPAEQQPAPPAEQQPAPPAEQQPAPPADQPPAPAHPPAEQDLGAESDRRPQKVGPIATAAASTTVTIEGFAFSPKSITVDVGDTVTWRNNDDVAHSATAEDGSFDTGTFGNGRSRSETFDTAGTFQYICTPHPFMKGTVEVNAASGGEGGGESGSGAGDGGSGSGSGSSSGSGSGSSSSSSESGSSTSGSGSSSDSGSVLPDTGADAATLAILGLLFLALGAAVQRRARAKQG